MKYEKSLEDSRQYINIIRVICYSCTKPLFDYWYEIIYIYIRLKIKPNSVRIRSLSCQIFVLPSTGFELTPLMHCRTNRSALCPAP